MGDAASKGRKKKLKVKSTVSGRTQKVLISDRTGSQKLPVVREQFELAMLSPFKYPIRYDQIASHTARIAGALFVAAGTIFLASQTSTFMGYYEKVASHLHEDETTASALCAEALCGETVQSSPTEHEAPTPFLPEISLTIEGTEDSHVLSGEVRLSVYASEADAVELLFDNEHINRTRIGVPQLRNGVWTLSFDTSVMPDGEYDVIVRTHRGDDMFETSPQRIELTGTSSEMEPTGT